MPMEKNKKEKEQNATKEICKNCLEEYSKQHGLQKFCTQKCKDDFHNKKKREFRLESDYIVSQIKNEELNKQFEERVKENLKIQAQMEGNLADNQLIFAGLNIPDTGLVLSISQIEELKINLAAYLEQKLIKNTQYKYLEYGDYGMFWIGVDKFLLSPINSYMLWT
jgi:hypothetical protein